MSEDTTILYKCPYCVRGRFTAKDGWEGAVAHIKANHMQRKKRKNVNDGRSRPRPGRSFDDASLLDEAPPSYNEVEELMA